MRLLGINDKFSDGGLICIILAVAIITSSAYDMDLNWVKSMVCEVNATELEPVEILSNEVFIFNKTTKKVNIAK